MLKRKPEPLSSLRLSVEIHLLQSKEESLFQILGLFDKKIDRLTVRQITDKKKTNEQTNKQKNRQNKRDRKEKFGGTKIKLHYKLA